jgi:rubrerythrin
MIMGVTLNADEIFEIAEQIEKNGAKFYRAAAQKFSEVNQLLLDLAAMEDEHLKTFQTMRVQLTSEEQQPDIFDPDGQAQMYLRALADGHIFDIKADPAEKLSGIKNPNGVLKMALGIERDSIAYYVGLKEYVPVRAGRDKIEDIIKEEMKHIIVLSEKMAALNS